MGDSVGVSSPLSFTGNTTMTPYSDQALIGAHLSEELLALLGPEFSFPTPRPGTAVDVIWFNVGRAAALDYLRNCRSEYLEERLKSALPAS